MSEALANSPPAQLRDGGSTSFSIAKPALQSANRRDSWAHFSAIGFCIQTRTNIHASEDLYNNLQQRNLQAVKNKLNVTHTHTFINHELFPPATIHVPGWPRPTLSDVNKNSSGLRAILTCLEANIRYLHITVAWLPNSWLLLNPRIGQNVECRVYSGIYTRPLAWYAEYCIMTLPVLKTIKIQTTNLQWFPSSLVSCCTVGERGSIRWVATMRVFRVYRYYTLSLLSGTV